MGRLGRWIAGTAGGIAAYRFLRRRPQVATEAAPEPEAAEPDERADELRAKLAESRSEPEEPAAEAETLEERRRRVHEEGRAALDEMSPEPEG